MEKIKKNLLISGLPGIGKTTLIKRIVQRLGGFDPRGFYTEEIRQEGERKGFQLCSLDGQHIVLAHVLFESPYKVGKYRVDVNSFDSYLETFEAGAADGDERLIIIDEIGKMECLSPRFVRLIQELLDRKSPVIATIAHTDGGIKGKIKERDDVDLFRMNLENRDTLMNDVLEALKRLPGFSTIRPE